MLQTFSPPIWWGLWGFISKWVGVFILVHWGTYGLCNPQRCSHKWQRCFIKSLTEIAALFSKITCVHFACKRSLFSSACMRWNLPTLILLQHAKTSPPLPRRKKNVPPKSNFCGDSYYCEHFCRQVSRLMYFLITQVCQQGVASRYKRHFPHCLYYPSVSEAAELRQLCCSTLKYVGKICFV